MVSNRRARMALSLSHWESNTRYVTFYTGTTIRFTPVKLKRSRRQNRAFKHYYRSVLTYFQPLKTL